jgi:hypothetical protein
MSKWEIRAVGRETGEVETVYQGDDYSNVSDMMLNDWEGSAEYAHMSLFEDGRLIESHAQPLPRRGEDLGSLVLTLIIIGVVVFFFMMH